MKIRQKSVLTETTLCVDESKDIDESLAEFEARFRNAGASLSGFAVLPETPAESRTLMRQFARSWRETGTVSPLLLSWAAECFDQIARNEDADKSFAAKVFSLVRESAHRPRQNFGRDMELTHQVTLLRKQRKSLEKACAEVATQFHLDAASVKKVYHRTRPLYNIVHTRLFR